MLAAALIQENNQIAGDVFGIMKIHKTNLTRLCRDNDIDYQKTYRALHSPLITLYFITRILRLISPDIKVEFRLNTVSLEMEVFYTP